MINLCLRFEPATLQKWSEYFTTMLLSRLREPLSRELNNKLEQDYCRFQGRWGRGLQSPTCHWHVLWITPIQSDTSPSLYLQYDRFHWTDYILLDKLELRTEVIDTTSLLHSSGCLTPRPSLFTAAQSGMMMPDVRSSPRTFAVKPIRFWPESKTFSAPP